MSGPTGSTTLSRPFVQTDPERASCVNKTDSNNAENETRGIDAAGSGFRSVIRLKLTDRSWCLLRRRARREPMGRNRCGRRMGHRRVRNIDFTVNLIYPLLSRCPVSRRTRKKKKTPAHKQSPVFPSLSGSAPSDRCCALRRDNRINISGCVQRISDNPKTICYGVQYTQKSWETMGRCECGRQTKSKQDQCFGKHSR